MASETEQQITWSSSNAVSVSSGSSSTSDTETLSAGVTQATLVVKADNNSTPASGDTVDFILKYTLGDPDGAGTNEFTTDEHSTAVRVDTNVEDPAITLVSLPLPIVALQVKAQNNAASNAITVSGTLYEQVA